MELTITKPSSFARARQCLNARSPISVRLSGISILDRLDTDKFYILPSSVHEVIIVSPQIAMNIEALREMVNSVNATEVSPDEVLSYNVYEYSRKNGLKIA